MSLAMRKKRDVLFKYMTSADITMDGKVVINPLIGQIPSRQMVEDELDELLMSM